MIVIIKMIDTQKYPFWKCKRKYLLWNEGLKFVFVLQCWDIKVFFGASLVQLRNIWILCDLGVALESSLVTNQVCPPFSSSVTHLNTCAWEKTSSSHSWLHKHVDLGKPLPPKPGKAGQSPSSPWRYFEDTQIEKTYHCLNSPTPDLKKNIYIKISGRGKKTQPNFIECVCKLLLGLYDWDPFFIREVSIAKCCMG